MYAFNGVGMENGSQPLKTRAGITKAVTPLLLVSNWSFTHPLLILYHASQKCLLMGV